MKPAGYRPELDGVRAICIILTIAAHMPGTPYYVNGTVGVDIFFALSGWLITQLLLEEKNSAYGINLPAFYIRRAFRIIPLYVLAVAFYGLASVATYRYFGSAADVENFKAAFPWLISFNSEYRGSAAGNIFGHAWTLGIEEKFYIIWPLCLSLSVVKKSLRAGVMFFFVSALVLVGDETHYLVRGYLGLGFGTVLALMAQRPIVKDLLRTDWIIILALLCIGVSYVCSRVFGGVVLWNAIISFAAAFLIGGLWNNRTSIVSGFFAWSPLAHVGRLTYAIYLFHVLVINVYQVLSTKLGFPNIYVLQFVVVYTLAIGVALLLHSMVERPFISIGRSLSQLPRVKSGHLVRKADQHQFDENGSR